MGEPRFHGTRRLGAREAVSVSIGNPHRVLFLDQAGDDPLAIALSQGLALSRAEDANIEFVARLGPQRYRAVVYERGAGLTQACGTGACAVAAAAIARGEARADEEIVIELPGGALSIRQDSVTGELRMTGPAELVFTGEA